MWPRARSTTTSSSSSSSSSSNGGGGTRTAKARCFAARRGKQKLPARSWLIALMLPAGIPLSSPLFIIISALGIVADAPSKNNQARISPHTWQIFHPRSHTWLVFALTHVAEQLYIIPVSHKIMAQLVHSSYAQKPLSSCLCNIHTYIHTAQYIQHGPLAHIFVRLHMFPAERWEHEAPTSRQSEISLCNMRLPPHPPPLLSPPSSSSFSSFTLN